MHVVIGLSISGRRRLVEAQSAFRQSTYCEVGTGARAILRALTETTRSAFSSTQNTRCRKGVSSFLGTAHAANTSICKKNRGAHRSRCDPRFALWLEPSSERIGFIRPLKSPRPRGQKKKTRRSLHAIRRSDSRNSPASGCGSQTMETRRPASRRLLKTTAWLSGAAWPGDSIAKPPGTVAFWRNNRPYSRSSGFGFRQRQAPPLLYKSSATMYWSKNPHPPKSEIVQT